MFLHCCTSLPIDAHPVPSGDPGQCPPHDASVDVKVDQHMPNIIRHVVHRVEAMIMCLMIVAEDDAEHDGVGNWSSIDIVQVVIIPQLGGHGGRQRGNNVADPQSSLRADASANSKQQQ
jgi:hypothetical protein